MVNDGQNLINVIKERPLFVPMTLWSYGCIYALFEMKPLRRYDYYTLLHLSIDLSTEQCTVEIFLCIYSVRLCQKWLIKVRLFSNHYILKNYYVWDNFKSQLQALSRDCLVSKTLRRFYSKLSKTIRKFLTVELYWVVVSRIVCIFSSSAEKVCHSLPQESFYH